MRCFIDIDVAPDSTMLVAGMGRSGTTWVANLINYDSYYRDIFEPFLPGMVKDAGVFGYHEYLRRQNGDLRKVGAAKRILSGKVHGAWTDQHNRRLFTTRRIVKDIRANLMLGWLKEQRHEMPIILVVRNPLSVTRSWIKLKWGPAVNSDKTDLEHVLNQDELLKDFPMIRRGLDYIDKGERGQVILFLWCVMNIVPLSSMKEGEYLLVRYEDLWTDPVRTITRIFAYIDRGFDKRRVLANIKAASPTNWLGRDVSADFTESFEEDLRFFDSDTLSLADSLVEVFGLQHLYGDHVAMAVSKAR